MSAKHRVVVVGGGFAGLRLAKGLAAAPVELHVIDRRNYHLFQPLLYQVATGGLSPANIAMPLRSILAKQSNTHVLLDEVVGIDPSRRRLELSDSEIQYDTLVLATGSSDYYFGHEEWEAYAPGLKTVEDATEIRRRIILALEEAEKKGGEGESRLTFVVVGGGPTGVELAGAIAEIVRYSLEKEYRSIRPSDTKVLLVEMAERVLPTYPPSLSYKAQEALARLGVEVRTRTSVAGIGPNQVELSSNGTVEAVETQTVLWAAGIRASPLGQILAESVGVSLDGQGRIKVGADLTVPGHSEIFVIGDLAHAERGGKTLAAVAPVATQQGAYVAKVIINRLADRSTAPFRYKDRGSMATIGRSAAVADLGMIKLSGFAGWLAWLFIHLVNLAGFENRLLVFTQWAWNYVSRNRSARLITGEPTFQRAK